MKSVRVPGTAKPWSRHPSCDRSTLSGALVVQAGMAPYLFRCPNTGLTVQGWVADEIDSGNGEAYEAVSCLACAGRCI